VITLGRSKKSASSGYENEKRPPLPIGHYLLLALIAAGAFTLRYWFNFIDTQHLNTYGACDASEYLRNAQTMLKLVPQLPETFLADGLKVLTGEASDVTVKNVQSVLAPLKDLQISGPIFPGFIALSYALTLTPLTMQNWAVPLFAQCVISALTCVFIALTGCYAFGKKTGYLAGALAIAYPGFIVNSGRLYSETFAAFLLSVVLCITVRNFTNARQSSITDFALTNLINGFTAACLQLTRSLMVIVSAALVPVVLFQQGIKRGFFGLITLLIGFVIVAAPWLIFQKLAFGTASLVVDRVGHYNFFIGNNVDTSGWLSFPYPDGRGIEEKSLTTLARESYAKSPGRWLRLMQDKPLRLFKFPWNDFRASIGGIPFSQQVIFHQLLLLFAAIGMILSYLVKKGPTGPDTDYERNTPESAVSRPSNAAKTFILYVLFVHGAYMLFITVPRYNLTAMPEIILFAAGGISSIFSLLRLRHGAVAAASLVLATIFLFAFLHMPLIPVVATLVGGQNAGIGLFIQCVLRTLALLSFAIGLWLAISALTEREIGDERRRISHASNSRCAVVMMVAFLFPLVVLPANADGRAFEWTASMAQPGDSIKQRISIPKDFSELMVGRQPYLLIDADGLKGLAQTQLEINGKKLDGPIIPSIALCDEFTRFQDVADSAYMREGEWIFDCLTQSAGMRNSDLRQWFLVPIPMSRLKPGASVEIGLRNLSGTPGPTIFGAYPTHANGVLIPSVSLCSWEKAFYGVESDQRFSDPRYDIKIGSTAVESSKDDLSSAPGVQSGRFNIHLLAGPAVPLNTKIYTVTKELPPVSSIVTEQNLPFLSAIIRDGKPRLSLASTTIPSYDDSTLWVVRISGKVKRNTGSALLNVGIKGYTADKNKEAAPIAYISPWGADTPFDKTWRRFDISAPLAPGALRAPLKKIAVDMTVGRATADGGMPIEGVSEVKDLNLQITRLPSNPVLGAHQLY
jgi:hypothetical protein